MSVKNLLRNFIYLNKHSLWDQRENDIVYLTNKIIDDIQFEYDLENDGTFKPRILNSEESFDLVFNSGKSFVRTGDGEIKIMMGIDQPFQSYDYNLAEGLKKIFTDKNDSLLVGINRNYYIPGFLRDFSPFYRRYAYDYRQFYKKLLKKDYIYIDATFTAYTFGSHNNKQVIEKYNKWRNIFKEKKILLVCGTGILDKLDYDVFELAKEKVIINAPSKNAWQHHDALVEEIKRKADISTVIVFILGMAGKVMISELSKSGYICWDVGHLAKYYDAYKKGILNSDENIRKFYAPD